MNAHSTAKKKIAELRREIDAHDRRYYVEAQPTISDAAYDALYRELSELEGAHPAFHLACQPCFKLFTQSALQFI